MIRHLLYEVKIAGNFGGWLLPVFFAILRLTGVIWQPGNPAWLAFLEFVYPIPFALLAYTVLEGERARRTLEVLIAAPRRKGLVFFLRYLVLTVPFFCTLVAVSYPGDWLLLLAPGFLSLGLDGMQGLRPSTSPRDRCAMGDR